MDPKENAKFCRICIKCTDGSNNVELFEECNQELLDQLREITGLTILDVMNIPRQICSNCSLNLKNAYNFRQQVYTSENYFKSKQTKELLSQRREEIEKFYIPIEKNDAHQKIEFISENSNDNINDRLKNDIQKPKDIIEKELKSDNESDGDSNFSSLFHEPLTIIKEIESKDKRKKSIKKQNMDKKPNNAKKILNSDNEKLQHRYNVNSKSKKIKKEKIKTLKPKEKQFICDQCGNAFITQQNLDIHLRRHIGEKPFGCEICPMMYYTQSDLARHMRASHTGERPFKCRYCERGFVDSSSRVRHERTHTNSRPFPCTICSKAFTNSYIMKNHMLTHTKERAFECKVCNKLFLRQTHLVTHYRSIFHKDNEEKLANLG